MKTLLHSLREKKYLIQGLIYFVFIVIIYFLLDYLNISYSEMKATYGVYLVIINIVLNIIMGFLTSLLMISSEIMVRGTKLSSLGFLAVVFGMFTYGCAPCLIAFIANFGIVLSVIVLPLAGLPYKLISLGLIIIGLLIAIRQINKGCKIKINSN